MSEPLPPLLPFKIVGLIVALLSLQVGRELGWRWSLREPLHDPTLGTLAGLPTQRGAREALLVLANSRAGFAMQEPRLVTDLGAQAGVDGPAHLVFGPELSSTTLQDEVWRLIAYHPSVVVVQIDLLFPLGPKERQDDPVRRLRQYERSSEALYDGLVMLSRMWWARRVVLEVPMGRTLAGRLGEAWWSERRAQHERLRAQGLEVIADPQPWPDALYMDGLHFNTEGAFRFRRWLAERLAAR